MIRRVLFGIVVLWVVSLLTFFIFLKLPAGNPAVRAAGKTTTAKIVREAERALGLDRPWWVQYGRFAKGLIPWPGFFLNKQVYYSWDDFVPVTVTVAFGAAVVWVLIGIPTGVISAIRRRTVADRAAMIGALLGISLPDFWLAYVFLYIFWFKLRILPGSGIPNGMSTFQAILHGTFVLPWVVLASTFAGFYTRMVRGNLLESMHEDFVRTARAKGLSERTVIFKHAMRAALTPVVTMFGMDLGILLGGAVIAETVFNLP